MDDVYRGRREFGERKGWNRASIVHNVRGKPRTGAVSQPGSFLPHEPGAFRTVVICTVCATCITLLYVGVPLYVVSLFVPLGGWLFGALAAICVILAVSLSWFSVHETREFRKLAREL